MAKASACLVVLLAVLSVNLSVDAKLDHCPADRRQKADQCARDAFFLMDPNFKPTTAATHPEYCEKMNEHIRCIAKYGKECLKGFTQQSLNIGTNGFKKLHKSICVKSAPKKEEFLKKTQWLKKDQVDELYMCAAMAIKNSNYINNNVENDQQIQQGCCNYWVVRDCMDTKMSKLTTPENQKFLTGLSDETMTNLIKFLCARQDSLATCKKIMPKETERMQATLKSIQKGKRENDESFLIPFLQLISD